MLALVGPASAGSTADPCATALSVMELCVRNVIAIALIWGAILIVHAWCVWLLSSIRRLVQGCSIFVLIEVARQALVLLERIKLAQGHYFVLGCLSQPLVISILPQPGGHRSHLCIRLANVHVCWPSGRPRVEVPIGVDQYRTTQRIDALGRRLLRQLIQLERARLWEQRALSSTHNILVYKLFDWSASNDWRPSSFLLFLLLFDCCLSLLLFPCCFLALFILLLFNWVLIGSPAGVGLLDHIFKASACPLRDIGLIGPPGWFVSKQGSCFLLELFILFTLCLRILRWCSKLLFELCH